MSEPRTITDPADPRLADYTGLTDVELRRRREPAEALRVVDAASTSWNEAHVRTKEEIGMIDRRTFTRAVGLGAGTTALSLAAPP
ncbi:hypothetical protein ACIQOV_29200, partial [Kitasatospora sp. NPDC091257]